jgi:hypothetical protein
VRPFLNGLYPTQTKNAYVNDTAARRQRQMTGIAAIETVDEPVAATQLSQVGLLPAECAVGDFRDRH